MTNTDSLEKINNNTEILENHFLNLHSGAIHIEHSLTLTQRLAWFYMLYKAKNNLEKEDTHKISLTELKKSIGYTSRNNQILKKELKQLRRTEVEWNIFGKDKVEIWGVSSLFSDVEIIDGVCEYSYSPKLRKRFFNPSMYAKLNLIVSKKFKSKNTLAIYTLAIDYLQIKNNFGEKNISTNEMRKYLGLSTDRYIRETDLYKHVLKKAELEINNSSDINILIEPIRTERLKITGFKLKMSIKENFLEYYKPQKKLIDKPNQLNIFENTTSINQYKSIITVSNERLQEFYADNGISLTPKTIQEKLKELKDKLKSSFEDYLVFLMEYTKKENKKTKLKSISGFYIGLIKDDLQVSNYMVLSKKEIENKEKKLESTEKLLNERLVKLYTTYAFDDFTFYLMANVESLEERITEILNRGLRNSNQFFYDMLIKHFGEIDIRALTESSVAIKSSVVGFLKNYKEELEYPETSFEYWRERIFKEENIRKLREEIEKNTPL